MSTGHPLTDIIAWLDATLDPNRCDDYGPNGLQVDGDTPIIRKVITGVSANLAFIDAAAHSAPDLLVVHHGIYWHGSPVTVTGALGRRIRALLATGLSLAAYHLPLDGHPEFGNAQNLARALPLIDIQPAFLARGVATGCIGRFAKPVPADALAELLTRAVASPRLFAGGPALVSTVGIVTGGAPRQASEAAARGLDLYITGEATEHTQATAREERIHIAACGHHRTETFGPRALAGALAAAFPGLEATFLDIDNPA